MKGMDVFTIVQTVVMMLAAAGVALLHNGFRSGKWARAVGEERDKELDQIHRRLDRAGEKVSDLATTVQSLPDRIVRECITREVYNIERAIDKERYHEIRTEFRAEDTKIWNEIRSHLRPRHLPHVD